MVYREHAETISLTCINSVMLLDTLVPGNDFNFQILKLSCYITNLYPGLW